MERPSSGDVRDFRLVMNARRKKRTRDIVVMLVMRWAESQAGETARRLRCQETAEMLRFAQSDNSEGNAWGRAVSGDLRFDGSGQVGVRFTEISSQFPVLSSQFLVLSSQFPVLSSRF